MGFRHLSFFICTLFLGALKSHGTDMAAMYKEGKEVAGRLVLEGPKTPTGVSLPGYAGTDIPESRLRADELESRAKERLEVATGHMRENNTLSRKKQTVTAETALLTSFHQKPDERIDEAAPFMKVSNDIAVDPLKTLNAQKDTIKNEIITKQWKETCAEPSEAFFMEDTSYLTHVEVVEKKKEKAGARVLALYMKTKYAHAIGLFMECDTESAFYRKNIAEKKATMTDPYVMKILRDAGFQGIHIEGFFFGAHPAVYFQEFHASPFFIKSFASADEMIGFFKPIEKERFIWGRRVKSFDEDMRSYFQEAEQIKYYRRLSRIPVRPSLEDRGTQEEWVETSKEDFERGPEDLGEAHDTWSRHNDFYETYVDAGVCTYDVMSCLEGEGTRSLENIPIKRPCWARKKRYQCQDKGAGTCDHLRRKGCLQMTATCLRKIGDHCVYYSKEFECTARIDTGRKTRIKGMLPFCIDGKCHDIDWLPNTDMAEVLARFATFNEMAKDFDGKSQTVFKGEAIGCSTHLLNFSSCCGRGSGWGTSIGLTKCSEDERRLAKLREQNKCVLTGTYCAEKKLGVCIRKKTNFCCFGSKLARIFHEQARPQLGMNFGSASSPACQGLSFTQIATLDYEKVDLTELFDELMAKVKNPHTKATTQKFEAQWKGNLPHQVSASTSHNSLPQMSRRIEERKSDINDRSGNFTLHSEHESHDLATPEISDGTHEKAKLVF
ncbi:MAG: conjugal transfer protein TraN [Alphaproteobacteria bacterium]|jgi:hypothetical protein